MFIYQRLFSNAFPVVPVVPSTQASNRCISQSHSSASAGSPRRAQALIMVV